MTIADPVTLLQMYDRGMLTGHELCARLIQAAATQAPTEIAALLTTELLTDLRRETAEPPDRPERRVWAGIVTISSGAAWDQKAQEERRLWYEGA